MNDIIVLPSKRTAFLFSHCFSCYEILDMIREASDSNIKIKFTDIKEDVTLVVERYYGTEYYRGDYLTISANNAEFIGGKFGIVEPFDRLCHAKIIIAGHNRNFIDFIAERADAIYELTGKSIYIKEIIYIDNSKDDFFNSAFVADCKSILNCQIEAYIHNRWDFVKPLNQIVAPPEEPK